MNTYACYPTVLVMMVIFFPLFLVFSLRSTDLKLIFTTIFFFFYGTDEFPFCVIYLSGSLLILIFENILCSRCARDAN